MSSDNPSTNPSAFNRLTPEQRRAISSAGGKAAHAQGKAHKWTVEEARAAGSKGGRAAVEKRAGVHGSKARRDP